ncbi:MAG: hypothetical protein U1U88_001622 [Lawsonella clevelandensis]
MIKDALDQLVRGDNLSAPTMRYMMDEIMTGEASDIMKAAALTALSIKGETVEEITAAAQSMRNHGTRIDHNRDLLEIVGTGETKHSPSTSPPPPASSSPRQECPSPSTATAPHPPSLAPPTVWRPWVPASTSVRRATWNYSTTSICASSSRSATTPP